MACPHRQHGSRRARTRGLSTSVQRLPRLPALGPAITHRVPSPPTGSAVLSSAMGIKDWAAKAPIGSFETVVLYRERIKRGLKEERPLAGVSATVESGSALDKRVTLTRVAALGVFSLAAKKRQGGESYLIIEGPDFQWSIEVGRKDQAKAREFAAKVTTAARQAAAAEPTA